MQFGCCCSIDNAEIAQSAGFDYIETTVVSLLPEANEATFAPVLEKYQATGIPIQACNVFLPGDLKVVGPEVDQARIKRYVETAMRRVMLVGARVVVFGSGKARHIPDGFDADTAHRQLVDFLRLVADEAEQHEITVVIEPLNRRESNVINSVPEGAALADAVNRPSIKALADFYHMDEENEPLSNIVACKAQLGHIHVADTDRRAPGTGNYPYTEFVKQVRLAGYDSMISIECRWEDFATEAGPANAYLREVFAK